LGAIAIDIIINNEAIDPLMLNPKVTEFVYFIGSLAAIP
jgi:hypothetical protein